MERGLIIIVQNSTHNHTAVIYEVHVAARQLTEEQLQIISHRTVIVLKPRHTLALSKRQHPDVLVVSKDTSNARVTLRRRELMESLTLPESEKRTRAQLE